MLLFLIILLLLTPVISSLIVLRKSFKYYKPIYDELKNCSIKNTYSDLVYFNNINQSIWFKDDDNFKLTDEVYLHNYFPTYFGIYSWYWLIKYKKLMKERFAKM